MNFIWNSDDNLKQHKNSFSKPNNKQWVRQNFIANILVKTNNYIVGAPILIIMGRKPVTNPAVQLSVSLPRDLVERIDRIPGSRSQVIQKSLKETLPKDYDISIMEYFFNALQGQIGQSKIMHALNRASVEEHLRQSWKISSRLNIWDTVPPEVRDWCHAFILPLEEELGNLSDSERELLMIMAKKRLCRLLGWEDNCRGYC